MTKPMSDAELRRRKKIQGRTSQVTGTLGLASLGAFGASKVPGAKFMTKAPKLRRIAAGMNTKKLETSALGLSVAGGGIGGAGAFNSAAISNAESRRKKQPVKKSDPFHVEKKVGDWKTIDQREQTQRRDRKVMRGAGAAAGVGVGLSGLGYERGDKKAYERGAQSVGSVNSWRVRRNGLDKAKGLPKSKRRATNLTAGKAMASTAKSTFRSLSLPGKAGAATVAGAAAIGGGAKAHHTYQQHKINDRRRSSYKKTITKSAGVSAFGVQHD